MLACQVYLRKGRYLLVLKSLKHGKSLDPKHPQLHVRLVEFLLAIERDSENIHHTIRQVLEIECVELQPLPVGEFNRNFINECSTQRARLAGARTLLMIQPDNAQEILDLASNLDNGTHLICEESYAFIKDELENESAAETFKEMTQRKIYLLAVFLQTSRT
eukprot:TRINITY_DN12090_c0_g1_i1.p1 TRINITY_DN12090_c0_g1~~TRINITY_DN12090_c0_g1_i1.p1  ORF type:complete len:162 (-),score=15.06 TRINITY_DN12090_c0_g1_i1:129-614(-)